MKSINNVPLWFENIEFNEYTLNFIYDANFNFFGLLVNGINQPKIVNEILNKYCPDEVTIYIGKELNIKLFDLIFENLR